MRVRERERGGEKEEEERSRERGRSTMRRAVIARKNDEMYSVNTATIYGLVIS